MTFPIFPLPFIFLVGCLAGGFALVSLLSIAVWMWPALLRAPAPPEKVVPVSACMNCGKVTIDGFTLCAKCEALSLKVKASRTPSPHNHTWKPFQLGEGSISDMLTSERCKCGAIRDYRGPIFGWVMVKEAQRVFDPLSRSWKMAHDPAMKCQDCGQPSSVIICEGCLEKRR